MTRSRVSNGVKSWEFMFGVGLLVAGLFVLPVVQHRFDLDVADPDGPWLRAQGTLCALGKRPEPVSAPLDSDLDLSACMSAIVGRYGLPGGGWAECLAVFLAIVASVIAFGRRRTGLLWLPLALLAGWLAFAGWRLVEGVAQYRSYPSITDWWTVEVVPWGWASLGFGLLVLGRASFRAARERRRDRESARLATEAAAAFS